MAAALSVAKEVGMKNGKIGEKKASWWKRRIESDITNLRRDINRLERERRGETGGKGKRKIKELNGIKGWHKGSHGIKDQLLIDIRVLRNCKRRHINLVMDWMDYKKTYDGTPQQE